jgi:hypothetical protein
MDSIVSDRILQQMGDKVEVVDGRIIKRSLRDRRLERAIRYLENKGYAIVERKKWKLALEHFYICYHGVNPDGTRIEKRSNEKAVV